MGEGLTYYCSHTLFIKLIMAALTSYKTVPVKEKVSIKKFVQDCGLEFQKGCGYYQLTKAEVIQDYKPEGNLMAALWQEMLSRRFLELNPVQRNIQ